MNYQEILAKAVVDTFTEITKEEESKRPYWKNILIEDSVGFLERETSHGVCSECGHIALRSLRECPGCGAKMDEEENKE